MLSFIAMLLFEWPIYAADLPTTTSNDAATGLRSFDA